MAEVDKILERLDQLDKDRWKPSTERIHNMYSGNWKGGDLAWLDDRLGHTRERIATMLDGLFDRIKTLLGK